MHNRLWQEHIDRARRLYPGEAPAVRPAARHAAGVSDADARKVGHAEWTARPPGRLGRRLLADIELFLDFFAIARAD